MTFFANQIMREYQHFWHDKLCDFRRLKEGVHSEMKTCERLDYCPHIQPIKLIFSKNAPIFPDSVSVSKICTIRGPALHHPQTRTRTSEDLHQTNRGPASDHPRTCIKPSRDQHHTIWTCIRPSEPASFYRNLSGQLKKEAGKKSIESENQ